MPLIGAVLLFHPQILDGFNALHIIEPGTSDAAAIETKGIFTPLQKLYLAYYGFTLIAVATLVFQFFCPVLIKENGSDAEYIDRRFSLLTTARIDTYVAELDELLARLQAKKIPAPEGERIILEDLLRRAKAAATKADRVNDFGSQLMASRFVIMDYQASAMRHISKWLVIVGVVLLAFTALDMFVRVTQGLLATF